MKTRPPIDLSIAPGPRDETSRAATQLRGPFWIRNLAFSTFMVASAAMLGPGQRTLAAFFCEPWEHFACTSPYSSEECECWTNCLGQYYGICENSNSCLDASGAAEDACGGSFEGFLCDDPVNPPVEFQFRCEPLPF